jgi:hypothetical protein
MHEISSEVAFWILTAWCRMAAQLQVRGTIANESKVLPAGIVWCDPQLSKVRLLILDDLGQKKEWTIPLSGARFTFGVPKESLSFSELSGNAWHGYLLAGLPDGKSVLFAERFIEAE